MSTEAYFTRKSVVTRLRDHGVVVETDVDSKGLIVYKVNGQVYSFNHLALLAHEVERVFLDFEQE